MSLFSETREGNFPKEQGNIKKKLKVEIPVRNQRENTIILVGGTVLYLIYWYKDAKVRDFGGSFIQ